MKRPILLVTALALAAVLGCTQSEDDACAMNEVYDDGSCKPKPAATAGSSSGGDAGAPAEPTEGGSSSGADGGAPSAAGMGSGQAGAPAAAPFGASCETHADCGGETDYCAQSPVAPPYCTAQGCDEKADICPEGWACFDVSQFVPGEPWICMQPSM